MAKGVPFPTDAGFVYLTETHPDYPLILRMNAAVTQENPILLDELIDSISVLPLWGQI
jgi:hypothetical protein